MKKEPKKNSSLRESLVLLGLLFLVGLIWIFGELFPYMVGFDYAFGLLVPFAIFGVVWRVVRLFHIPDGKAQKELTHLKGIDRFLGELSKLTDEEKDGEKELPWAERVRLGLEPLEGSDQPKPEEMPWAERVRAGLESLSLEEDPPPAESHDHIPSTALEKDEKLEQLKVLLEAGLIDREEYEQKKREIKKER